jgi:hypothetical protein
VGEDEEDGVDQVKAEKRKLENKKIENNKG